MNKILIIIVSAQLMIAGNTLCMGHTKKKAKISHGESPAWKFEADTAISQGNTRAFAALVKKHTIQHSTLISALPALSLIALGPKESRISMATILLDNSDQKGADCMAGSDTALAWACIEGDDAFTKFLFSRGTKIVRPEDTMRHPLTLAIKYHPENSSLIQAVMAQAKSQGSLTPIIANTRKYFSELRHSNNQTNRHFTLMQRQLEYLDTYQAEIENSNSTKDTE